MSLSRIFRDDPSFKPVKLSQILAEPASGQTETPENSRASEPPATGAEILPAREIAEPGETDETLSPVEVPSGPDLEQLRQEARAEGLRQGLAKAGNEVEQSLKALHEACAKLDSQRLMLAQGSREQIINLVISLTRKIVQTELATSRDTISKNLEEALALAIQDKEYTVTLHPDDLVVAEQARPELMHSIRGLQHIVIQTDPLISRGGCLLESTSCQVDATLEGQIKRSRLFLEEHLQAATIADPSAA